MDGIHPVDEGAQSVWRMAVIHLTQNNQLILTTASSSSEQT